MKTRQEILERIVAGFWKDVERAEDILESRALVGQNIMVCDENHGMFLVVSGDAYVVGSFAQAVSWGVKDAPQMAALATRRGGDQIKFITVNRVYAASIVLEKVNGYLEALTAINREFRI
ncbi:hypothetical protein SAMN04488503_2275 [Humidesulfovibrio mexicanus]|uniref:Uncharacterized protein n=1 Tax=Humidesulfovibrio mexicanus TaxID=147047 RepID=A0A239AWK1_9BACT|nr:hypothetical protein [Humidesulfovibrio mexicanus]SNS00085.1 hypothetical protein SAMN04488503_2275 [Humidesulfovibrio mexicanus]